MASNEAVQKEFICPICTDYFINPKGLPCLHTFCKDCLNTHIMSQKADLQFSCPMCRTSIAAPDDVPRSEWIDLVPSNHHVKSIMDIVISNVGPALCVLCLETEREETAVKHCPTCVEDYCHDCAGAHVSLNATKNHILEELKPDQKHYQSKKLTDQGNKSRASTVDSNINAYFNETLDVRTDQDDEPAFITSAIFLEDDRILIADYSNYKIKLFRSNGEFVTEVCQVRAFALTLVSQNYIAVTEADCIKFFHIRPTKIELEKTYHTEFRNRSHLIRVSKALRGLHYCKGQFVVCSGDDSEKHVAILDADGNNKRHILQNEAKSEIFKEPWYCKFSDDLKNIYVSDGQGVQGCIKCLSYYGKPKWEYPCNMPRGFDTIGEHIFITDWRDDDIKILTKDGEYIKTLLTKNDGIRRPQTVAVNHSGDKLIVSNSPPYDALLLFELEYLRSRDIGTPEFGGRDIRTPQSEGRDIRTPQSKGRDIRTPLSRDRDISTPMSKKSTTSLF